MNRKRSRLAVAAFGGLVVGAIGYALCSGDFAYAQPADDNPPKFAAIGGVDAVAITACCDEDGITVFKLYKDGTIHKANADRIPTSLQYADRNEVRKSIEEWKAANLPASRPSDGQP